MAGVKQAARYQGAKVSVPDARSSGAPLPRGWRKVHGQTSELFAHTQLYRSNPVDEESVEYM